MDNFQTKLKKLRWSLDLTMKEFAKELQLKQFTYASFESGRRKPTLELLRQLVVTYNINLNEWILLV